MPKKLTLSLFSGSAICAALLLASPSVAADAAKPVAKDNTVGEVLVTAQRRVERLVDVPITIDAYSGEQLEKAGIRNTLDLTKATPGVVMDTTGFFSAPSIRGVTTNSTGAGVEANVATYVDGVYIPSGEATNGMVLPDVEQVEILKGPQGTLFGRNATGGAIQITTKAPSYTEEGAATVSYGSFNDKLAKGYISVPIVAGKVAISVSGLIEDSDGYVTDITTGKDLAPLHKRMLRAKLRLDPTDDVTITLSYLDVLSKEAGSMYGIPLNGNTRARIYAGTTAIIPTDPFKGSSAGSPGTNFNKSGDILYSAKAEWRLGFGTLTSLTSFFSHYGSAQFDLDGSGNPGVLGNLYLAFTHDQQTAEELSFASKLDGPFNFTAGYYYSKGYATYRPLVFIQDSGLKLGIWGKGNIKAQAVFGEAYYDITPQLHLIAGLRYSTETRNAFGTLTFGYPPPAPATIPMTGADRTWSSTTPRVALRYDLTPRMNVYASYTKGFRSGIFQLTNGLTVNPENVAATEVGFKGRVTDNLDLNASAYHYDYKDLQVSQTTCVVRAGVPGCLNASVQSNAAAATINGIDLEANLRLTDSFSVRTAASVLDAKYDNFSGATIEVPLKNAAGVITNTGNSAQPFDASGKPMIRAPKLTLSVMPSYTIRDVASGDVELQGTVYYSSRIYYESSLRITQKPYTTLDARATWTSHDKPLSLSVYGANLTDVVHIRGTLVNDVADSIAYAAPRTYGVELSYKF
jgi:iron complex outermembrane receptor protein